jgi:dolichol-phosphate mannosyltransferase
VLFPRRLRAVTDPMSGFFLVRSRLVDPARLRPHGFKILLELVVTHPWLRTGEVPFVFGARHAGASKASAREGFRYLGHLTRLRMRAASRGSYADVVPVRLVRQLVGEAEAAA